MKNKKITIDGKEYSYYIVQTVVVGSGAAGLNAAASLYKNGQKDVAIVTEGLMMGTSRNTGSDKQTYYKLTTCSGEPDSVRQMASTLYNGGAVDGDLALVEAALSLKCFFHLVDIGVPFPHNSAGEYVGYKTDHDPFRRGTSAGPLTSKYMTESLWDEVCVYDIPLLDGYQVVDLLVEDDSERRVRGLIALNKKAEALSEKIVIISAENIIYATGGEAGMYSTSVYPVSQSGGMGLAIRAGAKTKNLTESQYGIASIKFRWNLSGTYQQVIPRYISTASDGSDEKEFLDEYFDCPNTMLHAIFLKGYQWPFDPRKIINYGSSLIDILVYNEIEKKGRRVFLDYTKNPAVSEKNGVFQHSLLNKEAYEYLEKSGGLKDTPIKRLETMNPAAIELYRHNGIDLYTELLEIAVCAQHCNGGLSGNMWWESNIKHFFPVGEVNGTHGVYRPGGSALNSGQVGGMRAANYIANCYTEAPLQDEKFINMFKEQIQNFVSLTENISSSSGVTINIKEEREELGKRMSRYGAHIRSKEGIQIALSENKSQLERVKKGKVRSHADLHAYFKLMDLLTSQMTYFIAIDDYITNGEGSRGSFLVCDANGEKPLDILDDSFKYIKGAVESSKKIQEITYLKDKVLIEWRSSRKIPDDDCWFEAVWKKYREKTFLTEGNER